MFKIIVLILCVYSNLVFAETNENEVKSFVYKWFSQFDKNDKAENFTKYLPEKFVIKFPEIEIKSKAEFKKWYDNILLTFKTAKHEIEYINVNIKDENEISTDLVVNWTAKEHNGKVIKIRVHQSWKIIKTNNNFKIHSYIVDSNFQK